MTPLISFMVQNKNYGRYLFHCLNSILNQGVPQDEYEILGLDAGSTDNSQQIYRKLIGDFVDVTGCNQAEALNIALKMAKGEYVGWINSDDYYLSNYVKTHIALFNKFKHQNVSIAFTERLAHIEPKPFSSIEIRLRQIPYFMQKTNTERIRWISHKIVKNNYNPIILSRKTLYLFAPSHTEPTMPTRPFLSAKPEADKGIKLGVNNFREDCVHNPAAMYKKDAIVQIGGWNERLTFCIDDDLFLRLAQVGNLVYTPRFTAMCRTHGKNMSLLNMHAQELEVKAFYNHYKNAKLGELFVDS